jgi:hypothetical protein
MRVVVAFFLLSLTFSAQAPVAPPISLANDRLSLTIRPVGGALASVVLNDDADRINPLHNLGHFVCVDGFGPTSTEERAAGLPMHGEANRVPWEIVSQGKQGNTFTMPSQPRCRSSGSLPADGPTGRW